MNRLQRGALALAAAAFTLAVAAGCGPTMKGAVKEDVTLTEETQKLAALGAQYRGPQYNVAILTFDNRTPGKARAVGEAATDILRTIVKSAGLEPISLTDAELREQEKLAQLQQTGALKTGRKSASEGFEDVDFRISGAITSYSEVEEGVELLIAQSKATVARVQVDYALVDAASGKSLVAESGMGEYRKVTGGVFGLGSKTTYDPALRDGALRDALTKAMTRMIEKLNAYPFQGRVLAVDGATVVVKAGTRSRLATGAVLGVYKTGADLIDPDTGRVIGKREKKIGEVAITSHQNDRVSEAAVKSGGGFEAGDVVREAK